MNLTESIENSNSIAIFTHTNPDADTLCSALAVRHIIQKNFCFKNIDVFVDEHHGEIFDNILKTEPINPIALGSYDLAFVLDCASVERTSNYQTLIAKIPNVINIDHHSTNTHFGTQNYITPLVSSTCELVFLLAKEFNLVIDDAIAKLLYQGIITDTNCFTSNTMRKISHNVVTNLLSYNFNSEKIKEYYFKNNSKARATLLSKALSSLKYYFNETVAFMNVSFEDMFLSDANFDDTLGIIDQGISIKNVQICVFIIEKEPNSFHVSIRGRGNCDVSNLAKSFNGGGNHDIAAFQYEGDTKRLLLKLILTIKLKNILSF